MSRNVVKKMTYSATPYLNIIDGPLLRHSCFLLIFSSAKLFSEGPPHASSLFLIQLRGYQTLIRSFTAIIDWCGEGEEVCKRVLFWGIVRSLSSTFFIQMGRRLAPFSASQRGSIPVQRTVVLSRSVSQSSTRFRPCVSDRGFFSFLYWRSPKHCAEPLIIDNCRDL